jgi:hypothetical protein
MLQKASHLEDSCKHSDKPSGFIEGRKFLLKLSNWWLLAIDLYQHKERTWLKYNGAVCYVKFESTNNKYLSLSFTHASIHAHAHTHTRTYTHAHVCEHKHTHIPFIRRKMKVELEFHYWLSMVCDFSITLFYSNIKSIKNPKINFKIYLLFIFLSSKAVLHLGHKQMQ